MDVHGIGNFNQFDNKKVLQIASTRVWSEQGMLEDPQGIAGAGSGGGGPQFPGRAAVFR